MKNKVVEITDCNDCPFAQVQDDESAWCALDESQTDLKIHYLPFKIGKLRYIQPDTCLLKQKKITFKLKIQP